MKTNKQPRKLSWLRDDFERRFGFEGERYVKVGALLPFIMAAFFTVAFYVVLVFVPDCAFKRTFTERGWTQHAVVALGSWTFFLLWIKTRKIKLQRAPLKLPILPNDPDFALTVKTSDAVIAQIARNAESPKDFLVYRRIVQTLSNLRNLGRVADVDALFRSQAEQDESVSETSYSLITGFLWAIPILGFVGTVIGLSSAIGNFTGVLAQSGDDMGQLTEALKDVTSGLSTAFETTLVALSVALALQLFATFVRKSEETLLDDITEFCATNIITKIRVENRLLSSIPENFDEDSDLLV
ncbi:MAG: MotA/TolQ/ExbB proton channel family protein [Thermoguttaceae bacterium]|nr:MotA/TolQ/ExbB proton channel family protein [Thermoguttaceae bacterium]